ncbi:hypothetical protein FNYG_09961 [Fusarium nygamai]|uniref:Aminoglycoside phosphotransferase domain-containing protein n=1 Tax=Gibberella nygamai TaxID=42673 RepID=A0A2K0W2P1_GIBNY|nr:hypothetical protein FNYG_09961 [Fusarium nygamai]
MGLVSPSQNLSSSRKAHLSISEAAAMQFVAANTSIPVSTVHCSFVHKNRAHIVMQRIEGKSIADAWRDLSDADRSNIFAQLRCMFQELRSLTPPPNTGIESCIGGSLRDSRIPRSRPRFGLFKTVQDFHRWLREDFQPEDHPDRADDQDWKDIEEMITKQDGSWPPPVFTHGDLNPFNIFVRGDQVVGIIDWEFAGLARVAHRVTGRYLHGEDMLLPKPTWDMLQGKEVVP